MDEYCSAIARGDIRGDAEPPLTVIMPVLNEEKVIDKTLASLDCHDCEVLVVDGGSSDSTASIAVARGAKVISSQPGRGRQLNLGAEQATGDILLFLHADTMLPEGYRQLVMKTLAEQGVAAGAFSLGIDTEGRMYRLLEKGTALRSTLLGLPYGDQAIFLRKSVFEEIQGYPDVELMEDVSLVRKLRRKGRIAILPQMVRTSGRRWCERGVLKTTVLNQLLLCGFFLGVPSGLLARYYYGWKKF